MEYTREQAAQVLNDWYAYNKNPRTVTMFDDFLNHKFPKLEVGKWYKNPNGVGLWFAKSISQPYHGTYLYGYGIHSNSKTWCNDEIANVGCVIKQGWIPATYKEVKEALIAEAKRKGYKGGVKHQNLYYKGQVDTIVDTIDVIVDKDLDCNWMYDKHENRLLFDGWTIFLDGKWAEIIEEPLELTLDEIAEKFGVPVEQLKIKK